MHQDTSRLRSHLQRQDFHYQEVGQDAAVIEVCARWRLFQAIFDADGGRPAQDAAAEAREVAGDTA